MSLLRSLVVWSGIGRLLGGTAFIGPLDPFSAGLAMACDYRRLLGTWTGPLIRVQRTTPDTTQQDVPAASDGSLDEASLLGFATTGNAYVVKRYDQSGNGRDLIGGGGTAGVGPRIVTSGVVEKLNSHPCGKVISGDSEFEANAAFAPNYTGTLLAAVWAGRLAAQAANDRMMSVVNGTGFDWNVAGSAALISTVLGGAAPQLQTFTNNAALVNNLNSSAPGLSFGVSARFDGASETLRSGANSGTAAFAGAWNFNRIGVGYPAGTPERLAAGSFAGTALVWFANPGAANLEAVRSEAAAFWGAPGAGPPGSLDFSQSGNSALLAAV